jgi:hypothetical protein
MQKSRSEGGFETHNILSSAEEALTLFKGGSKNYKALVTDVNLKGRLSGCKASQGGRPCVSGCLDRGSSV